LIDSLVTEQSTTLLHCVLDITYCAVSNKERTKSSVVEHWG